MVFSYGHAMDGALGHGDALRRTDVVLPQPKLIDFFLQNAVPIQSVACGGDDLTGFHSAAVARNGSVYTWGVGVALGLGSVKSKSSPTRVAIPSSSAAMASIACGSGFCVALNVDGAAFAWGKWSDGRLGLGAIPMVHRSPSSSSLHRPRRQLQRFQLYPKAISSSTRWRKVSCGDAHCVALSRGGLVYVWGRGRQGQLGLGDVRDAMAPVVLLPKKKAWRDVAAGHDWSMAVDARGAVWSWGACGAAVLGLSQGDDADRHAIVADVLLQKHVQLRQQPHGNKAVGLTPPPRFHWLRPQPIPSLAHRDAAIQSISAGVRHAAAVSERGDLYVWGSPQQGLSPHPTLVTGMGLGATIAERVFCGGSHVVALTSGSFLARAMQRLHHTLQVRLDETATPSPPAAADAVLLVGGGHALYAHRLVLARRSPVLRDLLRSEERPSDAEPTAVVTEVLLPQLRVEIARVVLEFLYTDNITTALDPLSYLIRDVLRWARELKIPRLVGICRERIASASYVPLLDDYRKDTGAQEEDNDGEHMRGHSLTDDFAVAFGDATYADLHIVAEHRAIPVHRCLLLARSEYFRALLAFYDQPHAAARSPIVVDESYAGMVRVLHFIYHDELTTVAKTGQFPGQEASDFDEEEDEPMEQVLEDLIAADKYGLVRMKRLCEHRIRVTTSNCLDALVVADLVHADHLKHVALTFLHANLHVLNDTVLPRLAHEFPHLLTELYDRLHRHTQQQTLLRDWQRAVELDARTQQQRQLEHWQQARKETSPQAFPWVPLMLALVFAVLYLSIMHAREYDYAIVPAVNLVVVGGLLAAAFLGKI
jgi:alpha-tubulin suppressor-like RCC1 family protein